MNYFDFEQISKVIDILIGITAVVSLMVSYKALRKSEFDSAMNTSPAIIIRPRSIWVGVKDKKEYAGYVVVEPNSIIKKDSNPYNIIFCIQFECFNAGRGVAFNISQPEIVGTYNFIFQGNKIPLYLTKEDGSFEIELSLSDKFDELYGKADSEIPVSVSLIYTNDQRNIFCRSSWEANIRPFDKDKENLKVRDIRLLKRSGKIEYLRKPYKNNWNKKLESITKNTFLFEPKNIGILGLFINSFGAIISTLSLTASDGRVSGSIIGFEYHIAVISDYGFKTGLYLLILGFLFQILEKLNGIENYIKLGRIVLITFGSLILYIFFVKFVQSLFFL